MVWFSDTNNLCKILKRLAEYVKLELDCRNLRLDIYELDSYHIEFNTENKSTSLFLVDLSVELLMKYTYKELIRYARNKKEEIFEVVQVNEIDIDDSIFEGIEKIGRYVNYEAWIGNYVPLQIGINKEAVKEFYSMCETVKKYEGLIEELEDIIIICLYKAIDLRMKRE